MKRRDIIKTTAAILGYSMVGGSVITLANGCKSEVITNGWQPQILSIDQNDLIRAIVDRIIPRTDTPGALDASIDQYIDEHVANNYDISAQEKFLQGLSTFDEKAQKNYNLDFISLNPSQQDEVLQLLANEAKASSKSDHIFNEVRALTVKGFFTSEIGVKEVLVYDPIPGPFKGCVPLSEVGGTYARLIPG